MYADPVHLSQKIAAYEHALHVMRACTRVDQRNPLAGQKETSERHADAAMQESQCVPRRRGLLRCSKEVPRTIDLEKSI
jgi:hypothetical protein